MSVHRLPDIHVAMHCDLYTAFTDCTSPLTSAFVTLAEETTSSMRTHEYALENQILNHYQTENI